MIQIKPIPVGYPTKEANCISIRVLPFQTTATSCNTYYELKSDSEVLATGNIQITEAQFEVWANDNIFIENIVLEGLSLTRFIPEV